MKKLIFVAILLIAAAYLGWQHYGPQQPVFKKMSALKFDGLGADAALLKAEALLFNPNIIDIEITGIDLEVAINGNKGGKATGLGNPVHAPAGAEFSVPVQVQFSTAELMQQQGILGLMGLMGGKPIEVSYEGTVTAKALGISFDVPVKAQTSVQIEYR